MLLFKIINTPQKLLSSSPVRRAGICLRLRVFFSFDRRCGGLDFYFSPLLRQQTHKLVLVRTGNIGNRELKKLFARNPPVIEPVLNKHSLVELGRTAVRIVV
jgi:hypothetical protein